MEVSGQLHAPAALRREGTLVPIEKGGWMVSKTGLDVLQKTKPVSPASIWSPGGSACSVAAIPSKPCRLPQQIKYLRKKKITV
jgi:hypothetical protein